MQAMEAVNKAKEFILVMFAEEEIMELGLEELEYVDEGAGVWEVTFGFRRRWEGRPLPPPYPPRSDTKRTYKKVRIRDDGTFISLKHRNVTVSA